MNLVRGEQSSALRAYVEEGLKTENLENWSLFNLHKLLQICTMLELPTEPLIEEMGKKTDESLAGFKLNQ